MSFVNFSLTEVHLESCWKVTYLDRYLERAKIPFLRGFMDNRHHHFISERRIFIGLNISTYVRWYKGEDAVWE